MSVLLLLIALQSSTSMCDDLSGAAKELCLTGYSEAGQADTLKTDNESEGPQLTGENENEDTEDWPSAALTGEAAAAAGEAAAAAEVEAEEILNDYRKNWQLVALSSSKSRWFIKGLNMSSVLNISKPIWIKSDYSNDKTVTARTAMSLMQFDCQNRKTKYLALTTYNPEGIVLSKEEFSFNSWEYTVPDSVLENILDSICMD